MLRSISKGQSVSLAQQVLGVIGPESAKGASPTKSKKSVEFEAERGEVKEKTLKSTVAENVQEAERNEDERSFYSKLHTLEDQASGNMKSTIKT